MPRKHEEAEIDKNAKLKLGVAIALFLISIVWFTNYLGWWGGGEPAPQAKGPPPTPQEVEKRKVEIQQTKQENEELSKKPGAVKAD